MVRNFRLARNIDIAAMKINAINGRGSRKDFYDIPLLLQQIGLSEMLEAYLQKFSVDNVSMALRSLVYFKDAENTQNPNKYGSKFKRHCLGRCQKRHYQYR